GGSPAPIGENPDAQFGTRPGPVGQPRADLSTEDGFADPVWREEFRVVGVEHRAGAPVQALRAKRGRDDEHEREVPEDSHGHYLNASMNTSRMVTVGLVQQAVGSDPAANLEHTIAGIREAAARGARLVCLQELSAWYYFCQREDHDFFK